MTLTRTTPADPDYRRLVKALDLELTVTDGKDHAFYDQFNGSEDIKHVVLLWEKDNALACGAIKAYSDLTMEVKRMYTSPVARSRGLAVGILDELVEWAFELGYRRLILETGTRQFAAIRLYEKYGFSRLEENYGQYAGVERSVCMEKTLAGPAR